MKRLTLILSLLVAMVTTTMAQNVVTSTADAPVYYTIASYNRGGVITYSEVGGAIVHDAYNINGNSTWYFEAVKGNANNGVYIVNKNKSEENKLYINSDKKVSTEPAVWYILKNGVNDNGFSIASGTTTGNQNCLDASGNNNSIGGWAPSVNDWEGTTWVFFKESDILNKTYNPNGWVTRAGTTGRYIKSITINGDTKTTTPYYGVVYFDLTNSITFNASAGKDVEISIDRSGGWMNAFVYIDKDDNGFTEDEVVSYSYSSTTGANSASTELTDNNCNTVALPNFTAPTEPGQYRMRVKYDWDDLNPNGTDGKINNAGGVFVDVILNVVNEMIDVTYNFKFNGETKYTQKTSVLPGAEFPDYNVTFPLFIAAETKPTETVTAENATQDIELSISGLPFEVSTIDGAFGEEVKWYYLTMRSKDVSYDPNTGYALAQNVDEKGVYNLFAFTGNPFDGYSIYNYAAGADKVFWRADATDGGRVSFTNIEKTDGNTWILSANGTSGYVFRLNGYDNGYMNDHQPQIAIWNSSYGATDGGSTFTFTYVEDPDLTILYDVTYNYYYGEKLVSTKTITVENGAAYPAHTYTTPYGVSIVEDVPTENVSATVTKNFTLNIDTPVPFTAAVDGTPTTWYYTRMHGNASTQSYIEDNGDGSVEWSDKSVAEKDVESHLWGFVGNIFDGYKVVNKATGKAIASTGSGNASMAEVANATAFIAMPSKNTTEGTFCLKYPNGNYLNAQDGAVAHWWDNDNGSSFFLDEYSETEITVSEAGWATMYLNIPVYIPEGVNAYIVTGAANGYVTKIQLEGTIPANTGVLLENEGTFTFKRSAASGTDVATTTGNLLQGSVADETITKDTGNTYYVLGLVDSEVGFAKPNEDNEATFTNKANKAYFKLANEVAQGSVGFRFEGGNTTAVEKVEVENEVKEIYDLQGRRIDEITKPGIYVVNGNKVLVK